MQQQQIVTLQRHLHSPPANTATLGEANKCREEGQRGECHLPPCLTSPSLNPTGAGLPVSRVSHSTPLSVLQVTLPVYLNFTRADLIFTVDFEIATKEDPRSFYERGVAVLCTE